MTYVNMITDACHTLDVLWTYSNKNVHFLAGHHDLSSVRVLHHITNTDVCSLSWKCYGHCANQYEMFFASLYVQPPHAVPMHMIHTCNIVYTLTFCGVELLRIAIFVKRNCLSINIDVFNNSPTTLKKFRNRCYRHCDCHQVILHSVAGNHKLLIHTYICLIFINVFHTTCATVEI